MISMVDLGVFRRERKHRELANYLEEEREDQEGREDEDQEEGSRMDREREARIARLINENRELRGRVRRRNRVIILVLLFIVALILSGWVLLFWA